MHDKGWQAQNSSDLKGFCISLFIPLWENYHSCTFIYSRTSISTIKKYFAFVLPGGLFIATIIECNKKSYLESRVFKNINTQLFAQLHT